MCGTGVLRLVIAVGLDGKRLLDGYLGGLYTECVDIGFFSGWLVMGEGLLGQGEDLVVVLLVDEGSGLYCSVCDEVVVEGWGHGVS